MDTQDEMPSEAALLEAALSAPCEYCDEIIRVGKKIDPSDVPPSCRPQLALLGLLKSGEEQS